MFYVWREELDIYINIIPEQRIFREATNLFQSYSDEEFYQRFRLTKESVVNVLDIIGPNISPITQRNKSITALNQLLLTLRFLATGTFQNIIGDVIGIYKTTVYRILKKVLSAIANLSGNYIEMPTMPEDIASIKTQFAPMYGFPNVLMKLILKFSHLVVKMQSAIGIGRDIFHTMYKFFVAQAYPCKRYLMTPILNTRNDSEVRYNYAQIRTRNCVERCFGVWKRRFSTLTIGMRTAKANHTNRNCGCSSSTQHCY